MTVKLKRLIGEAGAGFDESMGFNTLYEVLKGIVDGQNDIVTQFNQLKADYNAATTPTAATDLIVKVEIE